MAGSRPATRPTVSSSSVEARMANREMPTWISAAPLVSRNSDIRNLQFAYGGRCGAAVQAVFGRPPFRQRCRHPSSSKV